MSAFEEFVSRTLYMHFMEREKEGEGGISLPGAHHAACGVMQRITSAERSSKNSSSLLLFLRYQSSEGVCKESTHKKCLSATAG